MNGYDAKCVLDVHFFNAGTLACLVDQGNHVVKIFILNRGEMIWNQVIDPPALWVREIVNDSKRAGFMLRYKSQRRNEIRMTRGLRERSRYAACCLLLHNIIIQEMGVKMSQSVVRLRICPRKCIAWHAEAKQKPMKKAKSIRVILKDMKEMRG